MIFQEESHWAHDFRAQLRFGLVFFDDVYASAVHTRFSYLQFQGRLAKYSNRSFISLVILIRTEVFMTFCTSTRLSMQIFLKVFRISRCFCEHVWPRSQFFPTKESSCKASWLQLFPQTLDTKFLAEATCDLKAKVQQKEEKHIDTTSARPRNHTF